MPRSKKPEHKFTAVPKPVTGKPKKKAATSVKTTATKHTTPNPAVPTKISTYPLEEISDLLDRLPLQARAEPTRLLLTSISSHPRGADRLWAVLKTIILFVAEYGSTP
jgi:hypothetical protein